MNREDLAGSEDDKAPYSAEWYASLKRTLGDAACRQLGFYEIPSHLLLSVVVPVYNEEATLRNLIERVCEGNVNSSQLSAVSIRFPLLKADC